MIIKSDGYTLLSIPREFNNSSQPGERMVLCQTNPLSQDFYSGFVSYFNCQRDLSMRVFRNRYIARISILISLKNLFVCVFCLNICLIKY